MKEGEKGLAPGGASSRALGEQAPSAGSGFSSAFDPRCWLEFRSRPQRTLSEPGVGVGVAAQSVAALSVSVPLR